MGHHSGERLQVQIALVVCMCISFIFFIKIQITSTTLHMSFVEMAHNSSSLGSFPLLLFGFVVLFLRNQVIS